MQVTYNVKLNDRVFYFIGKMRHSFKVGMLLTVLTQKQIHKGHYTFMYASTDYVFSLLLFEAV